MQKTDCMNFLVPGPISGVLDSSLLHCLLILKYIQWLVFTSSSVPKDVKIVPQLERKMDQISNSC